MTPLEAARRLAGGSPFDSLDGYCRFCPPYTGDIGEHGPGCPWPVLPRIVATLETASRVLAEFDASPLARTVTTSAVGFHEAVEDLADALASPKVVPTKHPVDGDHLHPVD